MTHPTHCGSHPSWCWVRPIVIPTTPGACGRAWFYAKGLGSLLATVDGPAACHVQRSGRRAYQEGRCA